MFVLKKIIITLTDIQKIQFYDVEVPVDVKIERLKHDMIDTLNGYVPGMSIDPDSVILLSDRTGNQLNPDENSRD